ncbi:MAG: GGDEF domain-containing protein [Chitinispirillales bacterium]|jgi:diguanylate cyclase (GGDEF)-like protein|nr:GGDEF domain-containing protein [Chitinispirillales bacterium]
MDTNIGKKRPTLGFFISELENSYTQTLCRGITDAAAAYDANVIIFPGKSPKVHYDFQFQYNAIYELASKNNLDALILATGTMINFLSAEEFKAFYSRYNEIPLVSLSIMLEGVSSVLIDNKVGLRDALDHVISEHKYSNIAYISGPENNVEAQERYSVYLEALEKHGLVFDPELVYSGDFTKYAGAKAVTEFLDIRQVKFDALAAANDEMALAAMEELQKRSIKIPENIAIVGFDNVESGHYCSPSLTTVAQPIYEQAYKAVELACDLIKGDAPHNIHLPTKMVLRESCGCISQSISSINASRGASAYAAQKDEKSDALTSKVKAVLKKAVKMAVQGGFDEKNEFVLVNEFIDIVNTLGEDREDKFRSWQDVITESRVEADLPSLDMYNCIRLEDFFHRARMVLLESFFKNDSKRWTAHHNNIRDLRGVLTQLISDVHNRDEALRSIIPNLKDMGLHCCYIFLYDKVVEHKINSNWVFPAKISLVTAYNSKLSKAVDLCGLNMPVLSILDRNLYSENERFALVTSSLFYENEQIGFIVCEHNFNDIFLFESLIVEISCALKLANLIRTRQSIEDRLRVALEELESYNEQLNSISQTDELTGLLNRRGFLSQSRHALNVARRMKKDGLLFFADLDGLKMINDTYGHEEGDNAIKIMAEALKKAFRDSDLISRLGGDEYTVFTLNTTIDMFDIFEKRIENYLDDYNSISGKPYKVASSIGAVSFLHTDSNDVEVIMNQADAVLYQKKKKKKETAAAKSLF